MTASTPVVHESKARVFEEARCKEALVVTIGKLSRNLARIDFGLNLSFMVFTIYLSDLLIGVGFVTGVTFTAHL